MGWLGIGILASHLLVGETLCISEKGSPLTVFCSSPFGTWTVWHMIFLYLGTVPSYLVSHVSFLLWYLSDLRRRDLDLLRVLDLIRILLARLVLSCSLVSSRRLRDSLSLLVTDLFDRSRLSLVLLLSPSSLLFCFILWLRPLELST